MRPASIEELGTFVAAVLVAAGVTADDAVVVAHQVADAEACGYESQGLTRLGLYVNGARTGLTKSPTVLTLVKQSPSAVTWDANHGWGPVAALRAVEECARRAKVTGSCIGVIRNAGHLGRLGYYVEAAARLDVIGFIACSGNEQGASTAPWGGREPRIGTNPFAFGFPSPDGDHIVVDLATTQARFGKVRVAAATGEPIPEGWAFDADGIPTTNPATALRGTLAPLGGHKGFALAIAVELLCGGLGGSYPPDESTVFVAAYDIAQVTTERDFGKAVDQVDKRMRSSNKRPGFDEIRLPGQGASERRRHAQRHGFLPAPEIWKAACDLAASVGVEPPVL
jgi:L-2-hydroxycarboxylate dehydrogenase (NAD+)